MFSFVVSNYLHKNKNRGKHLKLKKMTCEKMKDQTDFFKNNFNVLQK